MNRRTFIKGISATLVAQPLLSSIFEEEAAALTRHPDTGFGEWFSAPNGYAEIVLEGKFPALFPPFINDMILERVTFAEGPDTWAVTSRIEVLPQDVTEADLDNTLFTLRLRDTGEPSIGRPWDGGSDEFFYLSKLPFIAPAYAAVPHGDHTWHYDCQPAWLTATERSGVYNANGEYGARARALGRYKSRKV